MIAMLLVAVLASQLSRIAVQPVRVDRPLDNFNVARRHHAVHILKALGLDALNEFVVGAARRKIQTKQRLSISSQLVVSMRQSILVANTACGGTA